MAGADQLGLGGHLVQSGQNAGLEGPEDAVKIVAQLPLVGIPVDGVDAGVLHGGLAEVGPQEVTGEQGSVRRVPGEHGIGPVEQGSGEEVEDLIAQVQGVSILHHPAGERPVGDGGEELLGRGGAQHRQIGAAFQQPGHAAGVVGLGVVHDQVVHLFQGEDLLHVGHKLVPIVQVDGFDEDVFLSGEQIGIVGGAVFGLHDDVKYPQGGIQNADGPDTLTQLDGAHSRFPFQKSGFAAGPHTFRLSV